MDYVSYAIANLKPSKLGCGCSHIASLSTRHSSREVRSTLLHAFDQGINFFDTADVYGQGDSERLLGRIFRNNREKIIICTKAGLTLSLSQSLIRVAKPFIQPVIRKWKGARTKARSARQQAEKRCFEPEYLTRQIESSLRRLRTDYIDLFLLHSPPTDLSRDESLFFRLHQLKQQGKIRYYGVSCASGNDAMDYLTIKNVTCLQVPANLNQPEILHHVLPAAKQRGRLIISREPLGGGTIINAPVLKKLCEKHPKFTPAQVALGYLLQRNDTGIIIAGMTCRKNLQENLKAFALPTFTNDEIKQLENFHYSPV